jgi:uncharacterized protein
MGGVSGSGDRGGGDIRARLSAALRESIRAQDAVAVSALRSALAAISNAEAVPAGKGASTRPSSPHVAGAVAGLGAAEVPRLGVRAAEISDIIRAEVAQRLDAADGFERSGRTGRAARLRREAEILAAIISPRGQ